MKKVFYKNKYNGRMHSCSEEKFEVLKNSHVGKMFELVSTKTISHPVRAEKLVVESDPAKEPAKPAKKRAPKKANNSENGD